MADQPPLPPESSNASDRQRMLNRIAENRPPIEPQPVERAPTATQPAQPRLMSEQSPFITLVCALIFLYVGFTRSGMTATAGQPAAYAASVQAFPIIAKICGFALLLAAGLAFARIRVALLIELAAAALAAVACVVIGGIWLSNSDNEGLLLLIFALINGSAARSAFLEWKSR